MGDRQAENVSHVGPIIFANKTAKAQLLFVGEVITFRKNDRTTGETWWRESRTGPKMGDVVVEFVADVCPHGTGMALEPYLDKSGFKSVTDWQYAIASVNGEMPREGTLYRAKAVEGECGKCGETRPLPTNRFCPSCEREEAHAFYSSQGVPR